jgi:hypothetical protein
VKQNEQSNAIPALLIHVASTLHAGLDAMFCLFALTVTRKTVSQANVPNQRNTGMDLVTTYQTEPNIERRIAIPGGFQKPNTADLKSM